jgi:4-hydroxybenzoate polyprenyltransferase
MNISAYLRLMRLHQPVGVWLLFWPCAWAIALAENGGGSLWLYGLFALGAVLMRGAGCIINDIADREFDRQVARTQNRPLASGELSVWQAVMLLFILLPASLLLAFVLGMQVVIWSAAALIPVAIYPLMKRVTWWPQLFLGLTFNWGVWVGWVAARGAVEPATFWLYLGCVFWTLGYDTIYARQDMEDDARIGVKSSALALGDRAPIFVGTIYSFAFLCWVMALVSAEKFAVAPLIFALVIAGHFFWQYNELKKKDISQARRIFASNAWLGAVVWAVFAI